jgi:hypothetical protein
MTTEQQIQEILTSTLFVRVENLPGGHNLRDVKYEGLDEVTARLTALMAAERQNPWDFVQPCEPECTPERHAYHQGQWEMAQRMSESDFPTDSLTAQAKAGQA